jgi:hypothetical protein
MPLGNNQEMPLGDWKPVLKCNHGIPLFNDTVLDVAGAEPATGIVISFLCPPEIGIVLVGFGLITL